MVLPMQQPNSLEVEVKIAVPDLAVIAQLLPTLGFQVTEERKFESNTIWDTGDKSLRSSGEIVRLRQFGDRYTVTYKGPSLLGGKHKQREELESSLTSLTALERIFTRLGLSPSFRYEKYRTECQRPDRRGIVTLDETPIGHFIELEGDPAWIDRTAQELGFPESSYLTASYATLYADRCASLGVPVEHMTFSKP